MTMSQPQQKLECIVPRYMESFRCTGSACEDDCCHHWRINIDQVTYKKVKNSLDCSKADRERFRQGIKRNRAAGHGKGDYASIALKADGSCPFQDTDKLCFIHRRFGEDHLSQVCQTYPRKLNQLGHRLEVTATLSCPVAARGCLLEENAMELVMVDLARHANPRLLHAARMPAGQSDPFLAYLDEIREVILHLLSERRYPLSSRLFFATFFVNRLERFFRPGATGFSGDVLAAEIDLLAYPANLARLHQEFESLEPSIALPMSIIQTMLLNRAARARSVFEELLWRVWETYGRKGEVNDFLNVKNTNGEVQVAAGLMLDCYRQRRDGLQAAFGARIDLYFENYCRNDWLGHWYPRSTSLLEHMQQLLLRLAVLRFMFHSHPELTPLCDSQNLETELVRDVLDRVAVEVFYKFSRGIEHDKTLLPQVQKALNEQEMESFAHSVLLIKF
jgi:lysine-N-methylase